MDMPLALRVMSTDVGSVSGYCYAKMQEKQKLCMHCAVSLVKGHRSVTGGSASALPMRAAHTFWASSRTLLVAARQISNCRPVARAQTARSTSGRATHFIFCDYDNCFNSKTERKWLKGACLQNEAKLLTYANDKGGAGKFADVVVEHGPDAADNRIIADVTSKLNNGASKVLVTTKDGGLKKILSSISGNSIQFAHDKSQVRKWLQKTRPK
jgi:hypothetical protein